MSAIIAAEGLSKRYDAGQVLGGIDLKVAAGERVALIGANGTGKSTLLRCLIGLTPISGGSVEALGERFERQPGAGQRARIRAGIGMVMQFHGLVRRRSVLSNVVHGMLGRPGGWRAWSHAIAPSDWRTAAMEALDAVRLADKASARADTLSGGQAQRVAIARALVRRPALLIADEPAASLDPAAGHEVMSLFAGLAREHGITLLFTSHDMDHACRYADRVIALRGGGVHFDRPSAALASPDLEAVFAA